MGDARETVKAFEGWNDKIACMSLAMSLATRISALLSRAEQAEAERDEARARVAELEAALDSAHANVGSNIWRFWSDKARETSDRNRRLIAERDEARAARPVTVKPLEWGQGPNLGQRVRGHGAGYVYTIAYYGGDVGSPIYRWAAPDSCWSDPIATFDAAKFAAQADYESRIMACLEERPVTVQEAAKVLLEATPNPTFDMLKPVLMGEYSETVEVFDEDGAPRLVKVQVSWDTTKAIIAAALRAIAQEGEAGG